MTLDHITLLLRLSQNLSTIYIYEGFENNQYTVGVFIDLKKTVDTVNLEILLDKINFYGSRGIPLTWHNSYLSHRQQCIIVHDHTSAYNTVVCGFPQGSVYLYFFFYTSMIFFMSKTSCQSFSLLMIQITFFVIMTWLPQQLFLMQSSLMFLIGLMLTIVEGLQNLFPLILQFSQVSCHQLYTLWDCTRCICICMVYRNAYYRVFVNLVVKVVKHCISVVSSLTTFSFF